MMSREEEIRTLKEIVAQPRNPLRAVAVRQLAEFGIDLSQIGTGGGIV